MHVWKLVRKYEGHTIDFRYWVTAVAVHYVSLKWGISWKTNMISTMMEILGGHYLVSFRYVALSFKIV